MQIEFAKYEGAGNDFILVDNRDNVFPAGSKMIAKLCDRHFGIGADGVMTLGRSAGMDCSMRYYNADGSQGEMCGNGGRCFALFAEHLGIGGETKYFDAGDGLHTARILSSEGFAGRVELGMIRVTRIERSDMGWFLDTGVPHYVEFVDKLSAVDVARRGRAIRRDTERFPAGTNVDFIGVEGPGRLSLRTYERGVEAETLACGTGAVAAAVVVNHVLQPQTDRFEIAVPGGRLQVAFCHDAGTQEYSDIRLTGDARRVFRGLFDTDNF